MYGLRTRVASASRSAVRGASREHGTPRRRRRAIRRTDTSTEGFSPAMTDVEALDVEAALDEAGVKNQQVREYVAHWAAITQPDRIEVVSAADDARLLQESLDAGELQPAGEGIYYSRSYAKDTARSEERTIVATSDPNDRGVYNNWRPASEMKELFNRLVEGQSRGKTM